LNKSHILNEVTRENRSVRLSYVRAFATEANDFSIVLGDTLANWQEMYRSAQDDERQKKVIALGYMTISLQVSSMKLFLSGQQVASGNLMRQAIESSGLTLLCSCKDLSMLDRFDRDEYTTQNTINDVVKYATKLNLKKTHLASLQVAHKHYCKFSHPSKMTLGTLESFTGKGIYLGAAFDHGKEKYYKTEVSNRLKFARNAPGFLKAVKHNLSAW
jgi:hypothetical protein